MAESDGLMTVMRGVAGGEEADLMGRGGGGGRYCGVQENRQGQSVTNIKHFIFVLPEASIC